MNEIQRRRRKRRWCSITALAFIIPAYICEMLGLDSLVTPLAVVGAFFGLWSIEQQGWIDGYQECQRRHEQAIDEWIDR